jgi:hypothetical protein
MDFKEKYLKYKKKYLILKNQTGGQKSIIIQKNINGQNLDFVFNSMEIDSPIEKLWIEYYNKNHTLVIPYYGSSKPAAEIEEIRVGAFDVANGVKYVLDMIKNGNREVLPPYNKKINNIIYGIVYCIPSDIPIEERNNLDILLKNVLMSVCVLTTPKSKFYIMVGISLGFGYPIERKINGLSNIISGFIANIMINDSYFGKKKISFITRPLTKMALLFQKGEESDDVLNINYEESLKMPDKSHPEYEKINEEIIELSYNRLFDATIWMNKCDNGSTCKNIECKINYCIGDMNFFIQFVGNLFSPRWPYTGKRAKNLLKYF